MQDLYAYRAKKPWQAPTSEVYLVLRAGMVLPPEEHTQLVRDYIAATEALPRPKRDNARVVLNGSFCEQPPLGLIKSIEMAGCYIVDDDFMLVTRWLLDDVPASGNPLEELSKAFLHRSATTAAKYDTNREDKGVFLLKQIKTSGAEGVIFAAPSFCDPALLERPMLQDVLSKHKVPHTAFKYAENTGQMAPIREQAGHVRRFDQACGATSVSGTEDHLSRKPPMNATAAMPPKYQEATERPEGGRDVAAEGDDQPQLS